VDEVSVDGVVVLGDFSSGRSEDNTSFVTSLCGYCDKSSVVLLPTDRFKSWRAGQHVQHAFPELSEVVRELLMSGTHPECWDLMFADFDD
jgi:hypothetical protein